MALHLYQWNSGSSTWTELNLVSQRLTDFKLTVAYSHPATLTFTCHQAEHTAPIADGAFLSLTDDDHSAGDNPNDPVWEGRVAVRRPVSANQIEYICYDATHRAGNEIFVMSGPTWSATEIPRLVYNCSITADVDYSHQRSSNAVVSTIIKNLLDDPLTTLRAMFAAPAAAVGYVSADVAGMDFEPQEKLVFESETLRSALSKMLAMYPQYRMLFWPGATATNGRTWRFHNVKSASQVTLTLNDYSGKIVLSKNLERVVENRYTAIEFYGPPIGVNQTFSWEAGDLAPQWTAIAETNFLNGFAAPGTDMVGRKWQVTDAAKRRLLRIMPTEVRMPSQKRDVSDIIWVEVATRLPHIVAYWDKDTPDEVLEPIQAFTIDTINGIIELPRQLYLTGPRRLPDEVEFRGAYYDEPLTLRHPTSGFTGTAYTQAGVEVVMRLYDEMLQVGYDLIINNTPSSSSSGSSGSSSSQTLQEWRLAQFRKLAEQLIEAYKDVVWTGGATLHGIDYDFLRLNKRVNFAGVDKDGGSLTTGWEAINAILTDVEYDYTEKLTTLTFSSDMMEYTQNDPERLKSILKIRAIEYREQSTFILRPTATGADIYNQVTVAAYDDQGNLLGYEVR